MTLSGRGTLVITIGAVVSLCLNLFLVGLMVGGRWHDRPQPWWGPMADGERPMEHSGDAGKGGGFMAPVPPEIRQQLKDILAPHEAEIDRMRKSMRDARAEVARKLAADPFDPAGFKQALDGLEKQSAAAQQMMHDMMLEAVPKLSPELRQRWAERWTPKPRPAPAQPDPD